MRATFPSFTALTAESTKYKVPHRVIFTVFSVLLGWNILRTLFSDTLIIFVKFEFFGEVWRIVMFFWVLAPCRLVGRSHRFRKKTTYIHLRGWRTPRWWRVWIGFILTESSYRWWALMNGNEHSGCMKSGNFFWADECTVSFRRRNLLCGWLKLLAVPSPKKQKCIRRKEI